MPTKGFIPDVNDLDAIRSYREGFSFGIVAWAYDADTHCESCALQRFGPMLTHGKVFDSEGNEVSPIFSWDEFAYENGCSDCLRPIDAGQL